MLSWYKENYKISLRLTNGYWKMWRDVPYVYSWLGRLSVVKMPNSSQLIYSLNAIFIKIPKGDFWNSTKMTVPFVWQINRQEELRTIWKQEIPGLAHSKNWGEKVCLWCKNKATKGIDRSQVGKVPQCVKETWYRIWEWRY